MPAIKDKKALDSRRADAQAKARARARERTLVNVSCGTCGIASGAEQVWNVMQAAVEALGLKNVDFIRSGCMTYCYAEPTVAITRPGTAPVVFGKVDEVRARKLIEEYVAAGRPVDGIIPATFERVTLE